MDEKDKYRIWFENDRVYLEDSSKGVASMPLEWFPKLLHANDTQRNNYELSPFGIHWPDIDEDLSFDGFFEYTPKEAELN